MQSSNAERPSWLPLLGFFPQLLIIFLDLWGLCTKNTFPLKKVNHFIGSITVLSSDLQDKSVFAHLFKDRLLLSFKSFCLAKDFKRVQLGKFAF